MECYTSNMKPLSFFELKLMLHREAEHVLVEEKMPSSIYMS